MTMNRKHIVADAVAYKRYAEAKLPNATPPRMHTNATQAGLYKDKVMESPRADADAHFAHLSRGLTK